MTATSEPTQIVITRALERAETFIQALNGLNAAVIPLPLIESRPTKHPITSKTLQTYDWVFFTSQTAASIIANTISEWPEHLKIAAVGPATAQTLTEHGHTPTFIAPVHHAVAAAEAFCTSGNGYEGQILWPCGNLTQTEAVMTILNQDKRQLTPTVVYETHPVQHVTEATRNQLELGVTAVAFTSASSVESFHHHGLSAHGAQLFSIGPSTSAAVVKWLKQTPLEAPVHSLAGLGEAIRDHLLSTAKP